MERREIPNPIFRERVLRNQAEKCRTSAVKRLIDVVLSIIFLGIFLPFLIMVVLLIKITSRGPVLYVNKRVGLNDSRFSFIKFRSMYTSTDHRIHEIYSEALIKGLKSHVQIGKKDLKIYKLIDDTRITPIGKIIRRLSIDEIPQFINVLKGEMSIVGPRPPIPYELKFYNERAKKRLLVKPGITGLWQVTGRSSTTFERMISLDLYYVTHWSIWLDIKIILKTFYVVFDVSKAY